LNGLLTVLALAMFVGILVVAPADGASATLVTLPLAAIVALVIFRIKDDRKFLFRLFFAALLARVFLGTLIYFFHLQGFFGGDALTYDFFGYALLKSWQGDRFYQILVTQFTATAGSGWGMVYMVAAIYRVIGRNLLAVQYVSGVLGAATAVVTYLTVQEIFGNQRVARAAALSTALFPSLVLWSSQGLKDGPIIFLLAVSMLATLKLGAKFSLKYLIVLILVLLSLLTLRFYVFYMAAVAVVVAFLIGTKALTTQSLVRQLVVMSVLILALFYFGVTRYAGIQFEAYGNLEMLQRTRADAAVSAQSGFGKDVDVSTTSGAIGTIPLGLTYLLLAPFPWQMVSVRSLITLPEMVIWWCSLPLLVTGFWFAVRYRLRQISPILIFTFMLTLSYSVFQGNIGNAYRQRAQLLIFYFIFVAVGFVLMKEKREVKTRQEHEKRIVAPPRAPRWRPGKQPPKDQMAAEG
jgi:4-amino-4-deoxy-L-arabinose transferase-like glycosyltransferase